MFEQDQRGSEFYIVLEGSIEVSYTDVDGVRNAVAYLEPGEFFGKMALLDGNLRSGTATAIKMGRACSSSTTASSSISSMHSPRLRCTFSSD